MTKTSGNLFWSRSERRVPLWIHIAILALVLTLGLYALISGNARGVIIWLNGSAILIWAVSLYMLLTRPALKVAGDDIFFISFPMTGIYRRIPRSQLKRLERTVADDQIVRYVAYTDDGNELPLPTAPRLEQKADIVTLDAFMQQHFADLLSESKETS